MSGLSVRRYVQQYVKRAIEQNEHLWIARRDGRTVIGTAFCVVDVSAVAQTEGTWFDWPEDGLVGETDFRTTPKAAARRSGPAVETFWRTIDRWRQAEPVWALYATGLYQQYGSDEDSDGNPVTLAAVLTAKRISDGHLRRVLIDRRYLHVMLSTVGDLEYCEMDMLAEGQVRIYSVPDDSVLLGIVMPLANGISSGGLYGTFGQTCPHCAGTGGTTLPAGIAPATEMDEAVEETTEAEETNG